VAVAGVLFDFEIGSELLTRGPLPPSISRRHCGKEVEG